jgi:competence protein ComEC
MAVSPIHILATLIGYLVYYIILFTNTLVRWVEQIPYAYVEGVQISIVQTILLYAITGALVTYLLKYDTLWLKTSLILCIVFAGIVSARNYQQTVQNEITVYNISNHAAIRITQGKNSIILADSTLYFDKEKKRFHLQQHIWNSGIKNETFIPTDTLHRLIRFNDSKIFIAGNSKVPERIKDSIDWMICNSNMPVKKLILLPVRNFILTPAVSYKHANTMARQLDSAKRNVVNVRETGAFQLSLQHGTNRLDTLSNSR